MLEGTIHRITKQGHKIKNDLRSHGSNKSSLYKLRAVMKTYYKGFSEIFFIKFEILKKMGFFFKK